MTLAPYVLVIGMAGSGKTTLVHRISMHALSKNEPVHVTNLDPAVLEVPYDPDIDIRDAVPYKDTMAKYQLGPNGAILTCLNLYAAQFDQVVSELEAIKDHQLALFDTPGQIELFTWSAAGSVITECLKATEHPGLVLYVLDTTICTNPTSFMSNMLYACSILYKTGLPMVLVLNKTDLASHLPVQSWTTDWEAFQAALDQHSDHSMMTGFTHSLSLVLEEFYKHIRVVGVSAVTGQGLDDLFYHIGNLLHNSKVAE